MDSSFSCHFPPVISHEKRSGSTKKKKKRHLVVTDDRIYLSDDCGRRRCKNVTRGGCACQGGMHSRRHPSSKRLKLLPKNNPPPKKMEAMITILLTCQKLHPSFFAAWKRWSRPHSSALTCTKRPGDIVVFWGGVCFVFASFCISKHVC